MHVRGEGGVFFLNMGKNIPNFKALTSVKLVGAQLHRSCVGGHLALDLQTSITTTQ
jgi:hypothetical protein